MTAQPVVIELWSVDKWSGPCPMSGRHAMISHAVAWYCGHVHYEVGEVVQGFEPDAIAAGMPVCRGCHDQFYGVDRREAHHV